METPPPNDSLKASLSPQVGGRLGSFRKDWKTNKCSSDVLNITSNGYVLPFISKPNLVRFPDSVRKQGPSKRPSSGHLYPVSSDKEHNRKGGKCKISRVLQSSVSSPEALPKVEASNRVKQAQHFSAGRKVQNGNSGEWVTSIDLSDAYLHIPIHPNSRKYLRLLQVTGVPLHLSGHGPPGIYNDCK